MMLSVRVGGIGLQVAVSESRARVGDTITLQPNWATAVSW
jgi:hypothetical protein